MNPITIASLQSREHHPQKNLTVLNPYDQSILGEVQNYSTNEVNEVLAEATEALPGWSGKTAKERSVLLRAWYELVIQHVDDLAAIMTLEQGKPLAESKSEIRYAASFIEWFSEEARRVYGDMIPSPFQKTNILVMQEPVGVCAAITPWNFPAAMITRKAAAALAAGCTMVVKPASQTPFSALALQKLAWKAGIPKGVLSVVTGEAAIIGDVFCQHPAIKKLSFTGSTSVGKQLMRACAGTVKRLSLELGGNAPVIICHDADITKAVEGVMIAKYRNMGQTCIAANRIFVHEAIYDQFAAELVLKVKTLTWGNGMDEGVQQGPLINDAACEHATMLVDDAIKNGATILLGGKRRGSCFEPTVIAHVTTSMAMSKEEIFAPIAALIPFSTDRQAIAMANDTPYGLAAYIFSEDRKNAWNIAEQLECGMVAINEGRLSTEVAPFGGIKESGFGREGSYLGISEYLQTKYMMLGD